jgi:dipeptidyl aminopeptidase/acylaminoacyl peptidase
VIGAAGGARGRELTAAQDRRARSPRWTADSRRIFFLANDRGQTLIYTVAANGGRVRALFNDAEMPLNSSTGEATNSARVLYPNFLFQISGFSLQRAASIDSCAFILSSPLNPAEVWTLRMDATSGAGAPPRRISSHNEEFVRSFTFVNPEGLNFKSPDGTNVQGWLMKPLGWRAGERYPLILAIHGGPHGMYGYGFNPAFQAYAARGYAVLYINPRGSTGYGQRFSDGTLREWGGGDYRDLMAGVDEALRRFPWIDRGRMGVTGGSYGGFMTNWIITQTTRFRAAVASASVSNLVSFYSTSLYQDLIHAEFGGFPWDDYDLLWRWSPLRYVRAVETPTLFIHGELDNDVHITQAEEMYMALRRRNIETVLARYPREGHGFREPRHREDALERTLAWFDKYLGSDEVKTVTADDAVVVLTVQDTSYRDGD